MIAGYDDDDLAELELLQHVSVTRPQAAPTLAPASPAREATRPAPVTAPAPANPSPVLRPAMARPSGSSRPSAAAAAPTPLPAPDPVRVARINALDWAGLKTESSACEACGLCKKRKQAVLGVGAERAPWMFIGEAPGEDEDATGEPFVGQAGKLLDAMLTAAGLQRGRESYIANVVKCRPPGNRTPTLDEAAACAPFLDRQIDLVQPKLIVALGKTAVMRLTGSDATMASFRGRKLDYRGIPVVATYHPSYLLRSPTEKLKSWEDLQFAKKTFSAL